MCRPASAQARTLTASTTQTRSSAISLQQEPRLPRPTTASCKQPIENQKGWATSRHFREVASPEYVSALSPWFPPAYVAPPDSRNAYKTCAHPETPAPAPGLRRPSQASGPPSKQTP